MLRGIVSTDVLSVLIEFHLSQKKIKQDQREMMLMMTVGRIETRVES